MHLVEQIDWSDVLTLSKFDMQIAHEPGQRHPEVIPHHDDALDVVAVALPEGTCQVRVCSVRWAWSHCSNWSRTMTTLLLGA